MDLDTPPKDVIFTEKRNRTHERTKNGMNGTDEPPPPPHGHFYGGYAAPPMFAQPPPYFAPHGQAPYAAHNVQYAPFPGHGMHFQQPPMANPHPAAAAVPPPPPNIEVQYPAIQAWLEYVDAQPSRRRKDRLFASLAEILITNGFNQLDELILDPTLLATFCTVLGIPFAVANSLLKYAKEDQEAIALGTLTFPANGFKDPGDAGLGVGAGAPDSDPFN